MNCLCIQMYDPVEAIGMIKQTEKFTNTQIMYHNYPGDLWSLLMLSVTVTSELKQRFIPLLKIHSKLCKL